MHQPRHNSSCSNCLVRVKIYSFVVYVLHVPPTGNSIRRLMSANKTFHGTVAILYDETRGADGVPVWSCESEIQGAAGVKHHP